MSAIDTGPSGAQKVAAFLLSLDKAAASAVLKNLDPKVVAEVAAAMTALDESFTEKSAVEGLYRELSKNLNLALGPRSQDDGELAVMLEAALGRARAEGVLGEIRDRRRLERPFAIVESEPTAALAQALAEESSAVAALVLAHLEPELSAEILSTFEPERALEVVRRIANLIPPGFEALNTVASSLKERLFVLAQAPVANEPALRLKSIAQMLNFAEPEIERAVLEGIESDSQNMAAEIRDYMFTWSDLATVDKRGMQKILASVETRSLAISLKACPAEVEANVMANLSSRVRVMVADERELAGALPMAEVLAARAEIMKSVRALMESGEFRPTRAGEELVQ